MNFPQSENYSLPQSNSEADKYNCSSSPYNSSLPSPPYSEESNSGDESSLSQKKDAKYALKLSKEEKENKFASPSKSWFSKNNDSEHQNNANKKVLTSPQLSKIYPNLFKNIDKGSSQPKKEEKKTVRAKPRACIKCCVCYKKVRNREFKNHLYFGSISCSNCGASPKNCIDFVSFNSATCCNKRRIVWDKNPVKYLQENLLKNNKQVADKDFKSALSEYIKSLHCIRNSKPYDSAFKQCNKYIGPEENFKEEIVGENDVEPSVGKEVKSKSKRNLEPIENIELPTDGYYLVVTEPIEECPNCYETLYPSNLSFNTKTWLITVQCEECHLNIYIVLNPPDGSEPKIKILKGDP